MLEKAHNPSTTQQKILDAAEALFALHGFAGTSIRAITAQAGVNLASAHYHFGSKEALIREVLCRRIQPLTQERFEMLDACLTEAGDDPPSLEKIAEALIGPALRISLDPERGGEVFTRLMGRAHSEPGQSMQRIIGEMFGETVERFRKAFLDALPDLSEEEVYWKFSFLVGSMAFVLAAPKSVLQISHGLCDLSKVENVISHIVPFVVAGLRAPVHPPEESRDA